MEKLNHFRINLTTKIRRPGCKGHLQLNLLLTWNMLSVMGRVTYEQWVWMVEERLEVSRLCGNTYCMEMTHIVIETPSQNQIRVPCHQGRRCICSEKRSLVARTEAAKDPYTKCLATLVTDEEDLKRHIRLEQDYRACPLYLYHATQIMPSYSASELLDHIYNTHHSRR